MKNGNGYHGSISNSGSQFVRAPAQQKQSGKNSVKKGEDLRTGKK